MSSTDKSGINDFLQAVVAAEEIEGRASELSGSAARGLLAWCLDGPSGAGGGAGFTVSCVRCGTKYQHTPPSWGSAGSYLDYLFACGSCKNALKGIFGTPSSPGRPEKPAYDQRRDRIRGLSHRLSRARHESQAPEMERPSAGRPSVAGPSMPRPMP